MRYVSRYFLVCLVCDPEQARPLEFSDAKYRGQHAAEHASKTGHTYWEVYDR